MSAKKISMKEAADILIVEDSPTQAEHLGQLLRKHGFQVTTAGNGEEALLLMHRRKPTIVISDIVMPGMDGYDLCRRVKADMGLKGVPFILLTVLSDPEDVIRGLECGADNFITKPYDEKYLVTRIDYLLANMHLAEIDDSQVGLIVHFGKQKYFINSNRLQIFNLLLSTYETAIQKNRELEKAKDEFRKLNEHLEELVQEKTAILNERVKELNCLYGISTITQSTDMPLEKTLQNVADFARQGWKYPEITCVRIIVDGRQFITADFRDTDWKLSNPIAVNGEPRGVVEVYYLEKRSQGDGEPFLKEERELLNDIARQLGDYIERKRADERIASQLEELRRWHEATLGREGRVLELKGEVNQLLAEAGRPPRYVSLASEPGKPNEK
jgi:DNA-binding response OmpR family regulator